MNRVFMLCISAVAALAQIQPTVPQPTNIDFSAGAIGQMPPGWDMPQFVRDAGYRTELHRDDCGRFSVCVAYVAPPVIDKVRAAELAQTFPAAPYIGKSIRFSAWLRLQQASAGGYVHIRMRVDYAHRSTGPLDSQLPPVDGPEWQHREVFTHVDPDAVSITIWARYVPSGFAWVASPSFEVVDDAKVPAAPPSFGVATAEFPLKTALGKTIRYGAWIKTDKVTEGYAGLWWRVDGQRKGEVLSFDNSSSRVIGGKPASGDGTVRGATGTSDWHWYEIELPVPFEASNINFGMILDGNGTAWFDAVKIEVNSEPYLNPPFDFDFESPTINGFFAGDNRGSNRYKVALDNTNSYTGRQSLKMQFVGDRTSPPPPVTLTALDPATVDGTYRSREYSTPVAVKFINKSSTAVDIYWIDYQGNRVLRCPSLAPGAVWRTGTFVTHPWLAVASNTGGTEEHRTGVRLAAFEPSTPAGGDAIITDRH
jgi:hypothetical protein